MRIYDAKILIDAARELGFENWWNENNMYFRGRYGFRQPDLYDFCCFPEMNQFEMREEWYAEIPASLLINYCIETNKIEIERDDIYYFKINNQESQIAPSPTP